MAIDLVGWAAVALTQVFYVPNTVRIIRTRDVRGYSLFAWSLLFAGLTCFLIYFVAQRDPVGIVANLCGVSGAGFTTFFVWLWRPRGAPFDSGAAAPEVHAAELTE